MDGVNVALGNRGMAVEATQQCGKDRKEWISPVHKLMVEFHEAIFAWFLCFFGPPSLALVAYHLERGGCSYTMLLG